MPLAHWNFVTFRDSNVNQLKLNVLRPNFHSFVYGTCPFQQILNHRNWSTGCWNIYGRKDATSRWWGDWIIGLHNKIVARFFLKPTQCYLALFFFWSPVDALTFVYEHTTLKQYFLPSERKIRSQGQIFIIHHAEWVSSRSFTEIADCRAFWPVSYTHLTLPTKA